MIDKPTIVVQDMYMSDLTKPANMPGRFKAWRPEDPTNFAVGRTMKEAIGGLILRGGIVDIESEAERKRAPP